MVQEENIEVRYLKQKKKKMDEATLTQKIIEYMTNLYNAEFVGKIKVEKNDLDYTLTLGIPTGEFETTMSISTDSDEDFLNFAYEELRKRNYVRTDYYRIVREEIKRNERQ